jgi:hypothetical protein
MVWDRQSSKPPVCVTPTLPVQIHRRHTRKYAQGELGPDRSFYFRGAQEALNLRAANLVSFMDIGDGVDDETWEFHRRRGDYSGWIRTAIKDQDLAGAVAQAEQDAGLDASASRAAIRTEIEKRYTAPAGTRA